MPPQDPAADIRRLELAIRKRPADVAAHHQLAEAHHRVLARGGAEAKLAAIVRDHGFAFTSMLHLAHLVEKRGDRAGAVIGYTRAIKTAQLRGFWYDENSTPAWLHALVLHAMDFAHRGRIELFQEWLDTQAARYGKDELARVAKCLAMWLGLEPTVHADPRQRPTFLYFPDLPVAPVFPREALPFADWYEAETDAILEELVRVRDGREVQPFHYDVPEERRGELTNGAWDAYFFYDEGDKLEAHHAACPHTSSVLAKLPLDHVRDHGPEWCFSIMRPGAHILPHRGVTNTRAVLHLGLEIPDGCALHLPGVLEQHWERGKCFAFDDTFEHEAWNRSGTTRAVLLGDIWNPFLRPA
ncbi:MAG: aspartyl/asparaginyl beta-hydroxylase domain-containing protein, partial [Acidobacteriota bacterium]